MEITIGSEKFFISDELIEALNETFNAVIKLIAETIDSLSDLFEQLQENLHDYCYGESKIEHYYDRNKGCPCKKVTYKCTCGKKFYETYECYEPPPKERNKDKVLQKNKKRFSNHK